MGDLRLTERIHILQDYGQGLLARLYDLKTVRYPPLPFIAALPTPPPILLPSPF